MIAELTPYSIEARYGDYQESLSEIIDADKAREIYDNTLKIFSTSLELQQITIAWLKQYHSLLKNTESWTKELF